MGEIFRSVKRIIPLFFILLLFSCGEDEIPVANFDTSTIVGEYSINLKLDYFGPRPEVSVFNGILIVDMVNSNTFDMSIEFPADFLTLNLKGTVTEKIVANSNSAIGGISFTVEDTPEYIGNPDKILVTTRDGVEKRAYAIFIDDGTVEMDLYLIETGENPTELELNATKID